MYEASIPNLLCFVFFFQAEDGIRDLVRSRGLGDVYKRQTYYKHIGIYGYRSDVLMEIATLSKTNLEITESLEQLRWIENGYVIKAEVTSLESIAIDTPDDLLKIKTNV